MVDQEEHITTQDVRAGATPHIVRYVLGISLTAVVIGMVLIFVVWR